MNLTVVKDIGIGVLFVIIQVLFFQHLTIFNTTADPIIFYLLWIVSKYERKQLLLFAAFLGLLQDAFFDFWGMYMFAKTLSIFLTFSFIKKRSENQLLLWQVFTVILVCALIHNIIFLGLASFFNAYAVNYSPFLLTFGNAIYTAVVGIIVFVFRIK